MRARKLVIGSGLLLAVSISVPALAQPASSGKSEPYPAACNSVAPSESERAHKLYEAGKSYYDDGTYDAAIAQFREAYKKDCSKHELLVIISRAYELKGDKAAAISALETFLERMPSSPDAAQHRTRIENLKKQLAAQPPPTAAPPPPPTTAPPPAEVQQQHTVPPWILVGVGGAAVVAGAVILATSPKLPDGCLADTRKCSRLVNGVNLSDAEFADRQSRAGASQNQPPLGIGIMIGGGVLVAGGLLWHFLEPTGPMEKTTTAKATPKLSPEVAPGYAGLTYGGRF
jgi:tetratricopeptide (TPR) repeat protein